MDGQQRYMAEPMLNSNRATPPGGQAVSQPPRIDYVQQQRYWQQQEYEMYRAQQLLAQQMPQMPLPSATAAQPPLQMQMPPSQLPVAQAAPVYAAPARENFDQDEYAEMMAPNKTGPRPKVARASLSHESPRMETPASASPDESEQNLKNIAIETLRFPIERAAAHVREDESSPLAEKSRQVFGMSWLLRSCEEKQDANIPRNRIYAYYVAACDEFKIKPLNHATFGKLVRVVFPNIKTRRLGVRGHSKYHYCGVTLHDNVAAAGTPSPTLTPQGTLIESFSPNSFKTDSPGGAGDQGGSGNNSANTSATQVTPGQGQGAGSAAPGGGSAAPAPEALFSDTIWNYMRGEVPQFSFPSLNDYCDSSCDPDIVTVLSGLYKTHCRALVPVLKRLSISEFIKMFGSFVGNVTMPVQRLLKRDETVRWRLECDKRLFSELALALAPLCLKPMTPEQVVAIKHLNASLIPCVLQERNVMPASYIKAKQQLSEEFVQLNMRLLAANDSAQNVLTLFLNPRDLTAMRGDWTRLVSAAAARDAPCLAPQAAATILLEDVPRLLENQQDGLWLSMRFLGRLKDQVACSSTMFLLGFSAVATNVLKDLTRGNAPSFGCWWIYRTWADDWLGWATRLVEMVEGVEA